MSDEVNPKLRRNVSDHAHDLLLALSSAVDVHVPGWGSAFGYLVGEVIPNRREDRFAEYLAKLGRKLTELEQSMSMFNQLSSEKLALFEDGGRESARSTTSNRIDTVADIVARGISADDFEASMRRDLLALFAGLSDGEIVTLARYAGINSDPADKISTLGVDRETAWKRLRARAEFHEARLLSLGLLEKKQTLAKNRYATGSRRSESPQKIVEDRPRITSVGTALLVEVGLLSRTL